MARIVVLDSGPLMDLNRPPGQAAGDLARDRVAYLQSEGAIVAVPEIVDYEVRRGAMHLWYGEKQPGRGPDNAARISRLDRIRADLMFIPLTSAAMLWAADAWGQLFASGMNPDDKRALGADSILAGQAATAFGPEDVVEIVTLNIDHLRRFEAIAKVAHLAHFEGTETVPHLARFSKIKAVDWASIF